MFWLYNILWVYSAFAQIEQRCIIIIVELLVSDVRLYYTGFCLEIGIGLKVVGSIIISKRNPGAQPRFNNSFNVRRIPIRSD